jgi:hypothetical protein
MLKRPIITVALITGLLAPSVHSLREVREPAMHQQASANR